jgi:hypothetical protein
VTRLKIRVSGKELVCRREKPAIKIVREMSLKVRGEMVRPERLQIRLCPMERK